ncbi:cytochrome P450 [Punctularia strigosozonata HHB-11173 SS5]|uniref:cytochrome P450 n=1 Tax=Punctularia strigosozonata (strain HHB-11173) TaxID=741275 RepID=UPI0004416541|nr:cytochrome P450 [Punctularia strigosozonata HHB-11173 SS5]EIN06118.1 cytochrome P450 [Punctularia strigosozonata HHB-11173 SS5]
MGNIFVLVAGSATVAFIIYRLAFRTFSGVSAAFGHLAPIPTIGYNNLLLSYIDAVRFFGRGKDVLAEGYAKHKGGFYKVALWDRWLVVVSGPMAEEMRRLPDDTMSFTDFVNDYFAQKFIFGSDLIDNPYHLHLIPSKLTKNLGSLFDDVREEVLVAFKELVPEKDDEWVVFPAMDAMRTVVCRTSNIIFVGQPLCRDIGWQNLNMRLAMGNQVASDRSLLIPRPLKPLLAPLLLNVDITAREASVYLQPLVEERQRQYEQHGIDYPDKPNDFLTWMMDGAEGPPRSLDDMARRILHLNFGAIHTSTLIMTHVIYNLATNPELWLQPLREEVERVAMTKMHKIDSFIKESSRVNALSGISLLRMTLKDYTFSDGTFIPKGTSLAAPTTATHEDSVIYEDPLTFKPWRFSDMREGSESAKHQFVNTSPEFLTFGHGKHACPGRFFAANELKMILAHIVMYYDVQLENESHIRPPNSYLAVNCIADPKANVCLRKRRECG